MTTVLYLASSGAALDELTRAAALLSDVTITPGTTTRRRGVRLSRGSLALDLELSTDVDDAVARTLERHVDLVLVDVGGDAPLARLDGFLAGQRAERDRERRVRRDLVHAVVDGVADAAARERVLYEVGARRIGGYLRGPAGADAAARRGFVEALCTTVRATTTPPPSKKALCAAGGGITGVYYELGVLKCLEDTLDGFSVHDFDLFFGISAGAIVTSLVANRIALDELLVELDPSRRGQFDLELRLRDLTLRDLPSRVACVGEQLRDYRDRVRSGDERFRWTEALGQLAALAGPFFSAEAKFRQLAALFTAPGRTDDFRALPRELYIGATDQDSREHVLFGAEPYRHVPISRAVQASAAIHPFLSSVEIDGRRYTDGFVTRTTNIAAAVERGANLIVIVDPFLPLISEQAGLNHRHGLFWVLVQDYKTVAFTRYEKVSTMLFETHPSVAVMSFLPSNRMRRLLAGSPISTGNFDAIVTQAYASTLRRLERLAYRLGPVLAEHGIELRLGKAQRRAQLVDALPVPRAAALCT